MINHFDNLLRHLFMSTIDEITSEDQVRFEPPDEQWRNYVSGLELMTLNVYLLDIKENRNLRCSEKNREIQNGMVIESLAPERIDCHYLITAWSPAELSNLVEPTVDEHSVLYEVIGTLMNVRGKTPRKIYDPELLPSTFPAFIADTELQRIINKRRSK